MIERDEYPASYTTDVTVEMESTLEKEFEKVCLSEGMTASEACSLFASYCVRTQSLPFNLIPEVEEMRGNLRK